MSYHQGPPPPSHGGPHPPQPGWGAPGAPTPPPHQGWGQPAPQPGWGKPAPPRRSNAPLWILLVLLVAVGGAGAFFLVGDDEGGGGGGGEELGAAEDVGTAGAGTPEETVQAFAEARLTAPDCDRAIGLVTERLLEDWAYYHDRDLDEPGIQPSDDETLDLGAAFCRVIEDDLLHREGIEFGVVEVRLISQDDASARVGVVYTQAHPEFPGDPGYECRDYIVVRQGEGWLVDEELGRVADGAQCEAAMM